jgi:hypothetical protein
MIYLPVTFDRQHFVRVGVKVERMLQKIQKKFKNAKIPFLIDPLFETKDCNLVPRSFLLVPARVVIQ